MRNCNADWSTTGGGTSDIFLCWDMWSSLLSNVKPTSTFKQSTNWLHVDSVVIIYKFSSFIFIVQIYEPCLSVTYLRTTENANNRLLHVIKILQQFIQLCGFSSTFQNRSPNDKISLSSLCQRTNKRRRLIKTEKKTLTVLSWSAEDLVVVNVVVVCVLLLVASVVMTTSAWWPGAFKVSR